MPSNPIGAVAPGDGRDQNPPPQYQIGGEGADVARADSRDATAVVAMTKEVKKDKPDLRTVVHRTAKDRRVRVRSDVARGLVDALSEWADRAGRDVRLVVTDGQDPEDKYNRTFTPAGLRKDTAYVWLCGKTRPEGKGKRTTRRGMAEAEVGVLPDSLANEPFPTWAKIVDQRGELVAVLRSNQVFLPFSGADAAKDGFGEVLVGILDDVRARWRQYAKEFGGSMTLRSYNDFCGDSIKRRRSELEKKLQQAEEQLRVAEKQVVAHGRALVDAKKEMQMLDPDEVQSEVRSQFTYLRRLTDSGLYAEFRVKLGRLLGLTEPVVVEHKGKKYDLGQYVVQIDKSGTIEVEHFKRRDPPHPHLSGSASRPCFGNISQDLPKLVGMERYGLVFQMVHEWLASYNEKDKYHPIEHFASTAELAAEELRIRAENPRAVAQTPRIEVAGTVPVAATMAVVARQEPPPEAVESWQGAAATADTEDGGQAHGSERA